MVLWEFFGSFDYFSNREYNGLKFEEKTEIKQFWLGEKGIPESYDKIINKPN